MVHVYIFYLESFAWTTRARAVFGTTEDEARATKELAYNQGFYNLFLAIMVFAGLVVLAAHRDIGLTLVLAGSSCMAAAALVLGLSSPDKRSSALKQGLAPALGVVVVVVGLLL